MACSFAILILSLVVSADDNRPARFDLHVAGAPDRSAVIDRLNEDWSVDLAGGNLPVGKGGTLISIRRPDRPLPPLPEGEHLLFMNGDKFPGHVVQLADDRLRVENQAEHQELTVPLESLAALWFTAPEAIDDRQLFYRQLERERRRHDRILLRNGDRLEGTLSRIDRDVVTLQVNKKPVSIERERVAVIALNTEFARSPRPRTAYGKLTLSNGARLSLAAGQGNGQVWKCKTLFGAALQISVEQVVALQIYQGCALYLSELKPKAYEYIPYFGVSWPWEMDVCVTGVPIRLAGSTYDKGIGMHSASRLTFELPGGYSWLEALVGIDQNVTGSGSAEIEVLTDGKPTALGRGTTLTIHSVPQAIRIPIDGVRELTLVSKFGSRGDVQAHVDWANARLIRRP